jgi:sulfopyruvate decarboxylase TPP-binding subunit
MKMNFAEDMVAAIESAAVKVASSVPDNWLAPVIELLNTSKTVTHAPAAREEDALGVCCSGPFASCKAQAH